MTVSIAPWSWLRLGASLTPWRTLSCSDCSLSMRTAQWRVLDGRQPAARRARDSRSWVMVVSLKWWGGLMSRAVDFALSARPRGTGQVAALT